MILKTIKTSRGNLGVNYENFNYRKDRSLTTGEVKWRCLNRLCPASIKTCSAIKKVKGTFGVHNHPPPAPTSTGKISAPSTPAHTNQSAPQTPTSDISTSSQRSDLTETPSLTELLSPYTTIIPVAAKFDCPNEENQHLRQRVAELEYMTEALTNKSIDLEKELIQLKTPMSDTSVERMFDVAAAVSTQTDPFQQRTTNQGTQTDCETPETTCEVFTSPTASSPSTSPAETSANSPSVQCSEVQVNVVRGSTSHRNSLKNSIVSSCKVQGQLTDAEVWGELRRLASHEVFVLPPTLCLVIQYCTAWEVHSVLPEDLKSFKMIIAPVSNARPLLASSDVSNVSQTGFNNEGSHWSLVVVDTDKGLYKHFDSLSPLNRDVAYNLCSQLNFVLDFQALKVENQVCHQQTDSVSCGHEVVNNAKKEVNKYISKTNANGKNMFKKVHPSKAAKICTQENLSVSLLKVKNRFSILSENNVVNTKNTEAQNVEPNVFAAKKMSTSRKCHEINRKKNTSQNSAKTSKQRNVKVACSSDAGSVVVKDNFKASIRLFSDSHGRGVAGLIASNLPNCRVRGDTIPNGKTATVLGTAHPQLRELGKNDYLILMSGTNDLGSNDDNFIIKQFDEFLRTPTKCKILVVSIPLRKDVSTFDKNIVSINNQLRDLCCKFSHASFMSVSDFYRGLFTRHGLHFNPAGKRAFARKISRSLLLHTSLPTPSHSEHFPMTMKTPSSKPFKTRIFSRSKDGSYGTTPQSNPVIFDINSTSTFPPLKIPSRVFHRSNNYPVTHLPSDSIVSRSLNETSTSFLVKRSVPNPVR